MIILVILKLFKNYGMKHEFKYKF